MVVCTNKKFISILKLTQLFTFLLLVLSIILVVFFSNNKVESWNYILLIVASYLLFNFYIYLKQYTFIEFEDDQTFIIIKYYKAFILSNNKYKIRINKNNFVKYEVKKNPFHKDLIIFVRTPKGLAKYPPISLSGFPSPKLKKIFSYFDSVIHRKSSKNESPQSN